LRSYHNFLGYFVRRAVYGMFGMYANGFNVTKPNIGQKIFSHALIKRIITFFKPRQIKDVLLWPIALLTFPLVFPWFRGANLMLLANKGDATAAFCPPRALQNGSRSFIDRSLNYGRHRIRDYLAHAGKFRTALDIGAGHGNDHLLARAVIPSADIHAVEVYPAYTADLAQKGIHVHSLNIEKDRLSFPDGSIDVIIANQILENVQELFLIFHEISRTLPIGSKLILGVSNLAALHNRILLAVGRQPSHLKNSSAHIRGYTKHDLIRFLEICFPGGYRLERYGGSNFYPFPSVLAKPLARMFPNLA